MNSVDSRTIRAGEFPQTVRVRSHEITADEGPAAGGQDSGPSPHDLFDAALATCKSMTAIWYARRRGYPLERVEAHVERDDSAERSGVYRLRVHVELLGPLSDGQRADIHRAIQSCPVHKLMTTSDVEIETI
jgi:putative redox protein